MTFLSSILLFLAVLVIVACLISIALRNGFSGLKLMLLGISIILFGGIIAIDPNTNLGGFEYLIAFLGLIISIVGFGKKD